MSASGLTSTSETVPDQEPDEIAHTCSMVHMRVGIHGARGGWPGARGEPAARHHCRMSAQS
jgi:hypothetical protein